MWIRIQAAKRIRIQILKPCLPELCSSLVAAYEIASKRLLSCTPLSVLALFDDKSPLCTLGLHAAP